MPKRRRKLNVNKWFRDELMPLRFREQPAAKELAATLKKLKGTRKRKRVEYELIIKPGTTIGFVAVPVVKPGSAPHAFTREHRG